jgi:hypothetical protein
MLASLRLQVWLLKALDSSSCIYGFVVNAVAASLDSGWWLVNAKVVVHFSYLL